MKPLLIVEGIVNSISERIKYYEEAANDLAHSYIQSDKPFPDDLKKRYDSIGEVVEGLCEAIDIVRGCEYMHEDVDLSGGEDIA